ncbi:FAD-dependent oxidoreductase [Desulfovibrio sp. DV]|uniref:FAD-dependent oxidoreductase n=1 Tax=Desulfovibrio sp. DV TaxID=1844708 RepID=UPI00094BB7A3|nr:FAD-dependent oxidoreductase [Desulfovibrio sp. DV]
MDNLLIIGGSDAGISAALRAREVAPSCSVTVMLADDYPNYSICGLPFFLSGEIPDWRALAHRTREELLRQGIRLLPDHKATAVRPEEKIVVVSSSSGGKTLSYDRLILATGAASRKPGHIKGLDTPGVFFLRWMADSFAIAQHIERNTPTSALIIGNGYIGMEMADALTRRGLAVTLVGHSQHVLKTVDPTLGRLVLAELERNSVRVASGVDVEEIGVRDGRLMAIGSGGFQAQVDLVLVATGAEPEVGLAKSGKVPLGYGGAIKVNRRMETGVPGIFAAGDCVETWHRLLEKSLYLPLGTTAHKQGRIAGENALGGRKEYAGTLGTQVLKLFDLAIARTGLNDAEARLEGFSPLTVETECWDHKNYYPGAHRLHIRVTGDRTTGYLLGAQIIGHWQTGVAKRIDVFATAIFNRMKVEEVEQLDLSYTPPLSNPWDPVQMSAEAWCRTAYQ